MKDQDQIDQEYRVEAAEIARPGIEPLIPILPWPPRVRVSGLYAASRIVTPPISAPGPLPIQPVPLAQPMPGIAPTAAGPWQIEELLPWGFLREELRLDVDGRYPQMMASGTHYGVLAKRVHWIARLTASGPNAWTGSIWFKDGDVASFPYTMVEITTTATLLSSQRKAVVRFSGGGTSVRTRTLAFKSPYFRQVEFEFDCATGVTATTHIGTHDHPNRPATLPGETLTIEEVSAGNFALYLKPDAATAARAGYVSLRFAGKAQWSLWVFFARLHEQGTSLGGIMFDDIGPNHRQGTAIFNESFISTAPTGDAKPAAWVERMRFWTACHEMGHAFNLAHSWQKQHPPDWVDSVSQRAGSPQLHELSVQRVRRTDGVFLRLRLSVQRQRVGVHASCAGAVCADGECRLVRSPWIRAGERFAGAGVEAQSSRRSGPSHLSIP